MSLTQIRGSGRVQLTREQEIILDQAPDRTTRWIAFAGCAKTTSCVEYAHQWKRKALYLAFNTSIAKDAKGKFPGHVETRTAHAYAFHALGMGRHSQRLVGRLRPGDLESLHSTLSSCIWHNDITTRRALLSAYNMFLISDDQDVENHHLVSVPNAVRRQVLPTFRRVIHQLLDYENHALPLTHDAYLKVFALNGVITPTYDYLFIDEAQDLNPVLIGLIKKSGIPSMIVGDPKQSIYAFRGARNAMNSFEGPIFTLSQSFRFGPEVAAAANWILRQTFNPPEIPVCGFPARKTRISEYAGVLTRRTTVLARTNMRIIKSLIPSKTRFHVIGGIEIMVRQLEAGYVLWAGLKRNSVGWDPIVSIYPTWIDLKDAAEHGDDPELIRLVDLVETYQHKIPDIARDLRQRHDDDESRSPLVVSTAHKAKGREWPCVVALDDFPTMAYLRKLLNAKKIDPIDYDQECHLLYVTFTRAMEELLLSSELYDEYSVGVGLARDAHAHAHASRITS